MCSKNGFGNGEPASDAGTPNKAGLSQKMPISLNANTKSPRKKWAFGVRVQEMSKNGSGAVQPPPAAQQGQEEGAGEAALPTGPRPDEAGRPPRRSSSEAATALAKP